MGEDMLDEVKAVMAQGAQTETIAQAMGGNVSPPDAHSGTEAPDKSQGSSGATAQEAPRKRWYAVQHDAFLGGVARNAIRSAGFRVHWPRQLIRDRRRDDMLVPLFRPYLFVEFDRDRPWSEILRRENGVVTILGIREFGAPVPARPGAVEKLIKRAGGRDDGWIDTTGDDKGPARASVLLAPGAEVEFVDDLLFGRGAVTSLDRGRANIEVMMEMFGMPCRVQVPRSRIKARDAA